MSYEEKTLPWLGDDRLFVHGSPRAVADCPLQQTTLPNYVQSAFSLGQIS